MPLVHIVVKNADLKREVSTFVRLLGAEFIGVFSPLHQLYEKSIKRADIIIIANENIEPQDELKLRESDFNWICVGLDKSDAYLALKCKAEEFILWPSDRHILKSLLLQIPVVSNQEIPLAEIEGFISLKLMNGSMENYQARDIILIEALGDISYIYFANGDEQVRRIATNESLKILDKKLRKNSFFRVHRKYIVNIIYIKPFGDYPKNFVQLELIEAEIPLARRRKLEFAKWYRGN